MTSNNHVMVDIETLGTAPGSIILSIGAVSFSETGVDESEDGRFYVNIDPVVSQLLGMEIDAGTVAWWMQQSAKARKAFTSKAVSLDVALQEFRQYLSKYDQPDAPVHVWGNGANFDNVLIKSAYDAVGLEPPWPYKRDMCYRTVRKLFGADTPAEETSGTHHNALDDAVYQAKHLVAMVQDNLITLP